MDMQLNRRLPTGTYCGGNHTEQIEYRYTLVDGAEVPSGQSGPALVGRNGEKRWQDKSSRDPKTIAAWFAGTDYDIAIHCGRRKWVSAR